MIVNKSVVGEFVGERVVEDVGLDVITNCDVGSEVTNAVIGDMVTGDTVEGE